MCNHLFVYPEDKSENYNLDGKTLTGVCKCCGVKKKAYGMRWAIPVEEAFLHEVPDSGTVFNFIDKTRIMC